MVTKPGAVGLVTVTLSTTADGGVGLFIAGTGPWLATWMVRTSNCCSFCFTPGP